MTDPIRWTPKDVATAKQMIDELPEGIGKQFLTKLSQPSPAEDGFEEMTYPQLIPLLQRWEKGGQASFSQSEIGALSEIIMQNLQGEKMPLPERTMKGFVYAMCANTAKTFARSFQLLDFRRYFRSPALDDNDAVHTTNAITAASQSKLTIAKTEAAGLSASMAILPAIVAGPLVPLIADKMDTAYGLGQESMHDYLNYAVKQAEMVATAIGTQTIAQAKKPEFESHISGSGI